MALIKCKECGEEISDASTECVHCGTKVTSKKSLKSKKEKIKTDDGSVIKPLITCRILFYTVLDKILLVILGIEAIAFIIKIFNSFCCNFSSPYYNFWGGLFECAFALIGIGITYFFYNWLYNLAVKTMLCATEKGIYYEKYVPFCEQKKFIPLSKVTSVSTMNLFWIFRVVIVHQYNNLPLIFYTWNNKEFKDTLNKLILSEDKEIENVFKGKNLIDKKYMSIILEVLKYIGLFVLLMGIIRFIANLF